MNTAVPMVWGMGPGTRPPVFVLPGSRRPTVSGRVTVGRRGWGQCQAGRHARGRTGHCRHDHWHAPCRLVVSHSSVFLFLVCTSCRGREATPPVDVVWLASNGSNPATFTADGLYLPGFRPNSLIGFGVRLMGMVVFVSFNVHAKSVYSNIFSVFTKVFE